MLADYHDVKASLSPIERELFSARLKDLDSCLDRGFYPLNWNSLGIGDFLSACTKAIAKACDKHATGFGRLGHICEAVAAALAAC